MNRFGLKGKERFEAFGQYLFGIASTYWNEVLIASPVTDRENDDFDCAVILYLKKGVRV